jgi:hypothetical protein
MPHFGHRTVKICDFCVMVVGEMEVDQLIVLYLLHHLQ